MRIKNLNIVWSSIVMDPTIEVNQWDRWGKLKKKWSIIIKFLVSGVYWLYKYRETSFSISQLKANQTCNPLIPSPGCHTLISVV